MRRFPAAAYPGLIETSFRCHQGIFSFWLNLYREKAIRNSLLTTICASSGRGIKSPKRALGREPAEEFGNWPRNATIF
jgi:hypothetical protein